MKNRGERGKFLKIKSIRKDIEKSLWENDKYGRGLEGTTHV